MDSLPEIHYDEWFHQKHPHDDMPIATNDRFDMYGSSDADDAYSSRHETTPVFEKSAEEIVTRIKEANQYAYLKEQHRLACHMEEDYESE
jgi:hypothetical protein